MSLATRPRPVADVLPAFASVEGAGFPVRRPFPTQLLEGLDPFILLDHMGPTDWAPGAAKGAPDHPHRGFETVTYMLDGSWRHRDSVGTTGVLKPGDVQWMTAGAGVVHSELPVEDIVRKGGRTQGFQLWVNLPRKDKWVRPRYQDTPAQRMPVVKLDQGQGTVKVVAGQAEGAEAVIQTRLPILYLHVTLEPGQAHTVQVPGSYNVFAYVQEGAGRFGPRGTPAQEGEVVLFAREGHEVQLQAAPATRLSALVIGGEPIGEPVAHYGPFVMNTHEEIMQAIRDYQQGRMGVIPPDVG